MTKPALGESPIENDKHLFVFYRYTVVYDRQRQPSLHAYRSLPWIVWDVLACIKREKVRNVCVIMETIGDDADIRTRWLAYVHSKSSACANRPTVTDCTHRQAVDACKIDVRAT